MHNMHNMLNMLNIPNILISILAEAPLPVNPDKLHKKRNGLHKLRELIIP